MQDSLEMAMFGTFVPAAVSKGSMHAFLTIESASFLASPAEVVDLSKRETRKSYLVKTAMIGAAIRSSQYM